MYIAMAWRCCKCGERTVKKLLEGKRGGDRKKEGRPRLRWMDDAELDFSNVGVKTWRRALNEPQWASVTREVEAEVFRKKKKKRKKEKKEEEGKEEEEETKKKKKKKKKLD
jgi:hypothetical protein